MGNTIWFFVIICTLFQEWVPVTDAEGVDFDCASCPENRRAKDKNGFLALDGCNQADVVNLQTKCRICATTLGATDVTEKAKKPDNSDVTAILTEGWIHSKGCGPPTAKPGTCDFKNDKFICYCNEPLCNRMPPPCSWLREANKKIPDPKGCFDVVDGETRYAMEYTVHIETTETKTYVEETVEHRGDHKAHSEKAGTGTGCGRHGSIKKDCQDDDACQYNVATEICEESPKSCDGLTGMKMCSRIGAFYNKGGVICRSTVQDENCPPLQVVVGTKVLLRDGEALADSRGIIYTPEVILQDELNSRTADEDSMSKCDLDMERSDSDNKLYLPAIYGSQDRADSKTCLTYAIPELTDGDYEFSVKFIEYEHKDAKKKRGFFLNLETLESSTDLVYNLDVFKFVGHCKGMDLITNMKVQSGKILLQGFEDMEYKYKEDKMSLSICYGEDTPDPRYLLSAFYVARMASDCSSHGSNKAACKQALCEFNLAGKKCVNRKRCNFDDSLVENLREYKYYADGGSVCYNTKQDKKGPAIETLTAVRVLLNETESVSDSRGVLYKPEKDYEDPHGTRVWDWKSLQKCDLENINPAADRDVFYPSIYGRTGKRNTKGCIAYPLAELITNGDYELSLKFLEFFYFDLSEIRGFSVRLRNSAGNDLELLYDLNVFSYVGRCNPFEVILLMKLSGNTLKVQGFPGFDIGNRKLKLVFCYGEATSDHNDPNYLLSAFYLAKIKKECSSYGSDKASCRAGGCEVNTAKNTCHNKEACDNKPQLGRRLWGNVYYLDGGVLCYNKDPKGTITTETITAQKLPGDSSITDSKKGIEYEPESSLEDPNGIRVFNDRSNTACPAAKFDDKALYIPFITASDSADKKGSNCMGYTIPDLEGDGDYELYLRMIEPRYGDRQNVRQFNIRFHVGSSSHHLLYQHDIFDYVGKCAPMDIVALFKYYSGMLTFQGFPPLPYFPGDKLQLDICYGDKLPGVGDQKFLLSAFHVTKYGLDCETIGKNKKFCKKRLCEVNTVTGRCENRKKRCDPRLNLGGSLRANVFFAVAGVLCYNEKQIGPILNPQMVVATKCGHDTFTKNYIDSRMIVHQYESSYEDVLKIRGTDEPQCSTYNDISPPCDRDIFHKRTISKNSQREDRKGCIKYPIPHLKQDGTYELSIKTWEDHYTDNSKIRGFRINLHVGDKIVPLLYDLNVFSYVGKCKKMEIVVPLQVARGKLTVMGFPNSFNMNGQPMKFAVCYGEVADDSNLMLTAFHVARLTPNCLTYGKDKRKCKDNRCEFNIAKNHCVNRYICPHDGRLGERLRRATFYVDAGTVCWNFYDYGNLDVDKVIHTVKAGLTSGTVFDSYKGITIGTEKQYDDPQGTRMIDGNDGNCPGKDWIPEIDKKLFFPSISGNPGKANSKGCLTYTLPVPDDGFYELSMRFVEYHYKTPEPRREFNVKLRSGYGTIRLLYNHNVYSYVGACNGMEVIANLRIKDGSITALGYPPIPLDRRYALGLNFCYGEKSQDPTYLFSSFYLAKLKKGCDEFLGDPGGCAKHLCIYDSKDKKCHERETFG